IRPLVFLGDASYSIYLSHTLAMGTIRLMAPEFVELARTQFVWFVGMLAFCIVVGVAAHLMIEKPMLRLLHRLHVKRTPVHQSIGA
ncbi:MAG: acyltransferase family protein, partial [Bradyrhizobium sp.]